MEGCDCFIGEFRVKVKAVIMEDTIASRVRI
jgi:hypothetical protein